MTVRVLHGWKMLDKGTIPLGTDSDVRRTLDERIREAMRRLSNDLDIDLEEDTGYFSKDIEYDEWDEFEDALPPSDPKNTLILDKPFWFSFFML